MLCARLLDEPASTTPQTRALGLDEFGVGALPDCRFGFLVRSGQYPVLRDFYANDSSLWRGRS